LAAKPKDLWVQKNRPAAGPFEHHDKLNPKLASPIQYADAHNSRSAKVFELFPRPKPRTKYADELGGEPRKPVASVRPLLGSGLLERVGKTPLIRLEAIGREFPGIEILAKAEWVNPGGSVKDRAALAIINDGIARGELRPGYRLLDSTSGNTGIAYAMLGAAIGVGVTLCVPANASHERKQILRAHAAEVIYTDPAEGSDGAIRRARELSAQNPGKYFYADQYNNPANWRAHYGSTAEEIWRQTEGRITHFVAALGTSGTFVGCARRLKELNSKIRCVSLQPDSPFHGLEGLKHMATAIVPGIYDPALADADVGISTEESYAMVRRLAREEGLLVGISSGTAAVGALRVACELADRGDRAIIVTIFPDSGDRYLSERFWDE
jgi:S-sulfo-L-cysteine synthase (O-acetyl-L-serine-dependent)